MPKGFALWFWSWRCKVGFHLGARTNRRLEAARDLIGEDAYRQALERLQAAQDAHSGRQAILERIPERIDWANESTEDINASLRALWEAVQLDENLMPVSATWHVPEWREDI